MSTHRKPRSSKIVGTSVVLIALVAGGGFAASAASAATGGDYVEIYQSCEGAVELSIVAHNVVEGSTANFAVDGTAADAAIAITLSDVAFGIRTSGIPMQDGDTYNLTATGPEGYSANFAGTFNCGANPTTSPTAPAVVPVAVKVAAACTADGEYSYEFTNSNDVAVMVKSSGFDDTVRTETVIPAGGTATVTSTLAKLYFETYVSGAQVPESATYVSAPAGLECTIVVPPTPTPSETTPATTPAPSSVPIDNTPVINKAPVADTVPSVKSVHNPG